MSKERINIMRKLTLIAPVLLVSMLIAAPNILAAGKGAVKADMFNLAGEDVGGINLNINAEDELIVTVHLNRGVPYDVTDVLVDALLFGAVLNYPFLSLDEEGGGSAQIIVPLDIPPEYTGDSIWVYVDCWGFYDIYYMATFVEVPLKKR
jgi:type III secretion system FlhB-like substrate exporter